MARPSLVSSCFSDRSFLWALIGTSIGSLIGYLYARYTLAAPAAPARVAAKSASKADDELEKFEGNYKMVLVVNTSLKMTPGKVAAQCGHATLGAYMMGTETDPLTVRRWETLGQAKVALKALSTEDLERLEAQAKKAGLPHCLIQDQGRTQIPSGSKTVLAIGPGLVEDIDKLTGTLKLF